MYSRYSTVRELVKAKLLFFVAKTFNNITANTVGDMRAFLKIILFNIKIAYVR